MVDVTVSQFADVLKVPVDKLLTQLDNAGIKVSSADDVISDEAKLELLTHLRRSHGREDPSGPAPTRITLKRKSQSEIRTAGAQRGQQRTVNIEVRRKRTYMKRDALEEQARQRQEEIDRRRTARKCRVGRRIKALLGVRDIDSDMPNFPGVSTRVTYRIGVDVFDKWITRVPLHVYLYIGADKHRHWVQAYCPY